ncbi:MAG: SUMF1/EgtB/PvdO family nonheme iron enzyme [Candidatus Poribacteria bacterium]|nr:SUMF1/EgtB/PvdO family nonheme iron enzyme [Candidatus Poribacteria bacterium]
MRKTVSILTFFLFFLIAFTIAQTVSAEWKQNTVINQSSTPVYVVYSTWRSASDNLPSGYRTRGYYRIDPGKQRAFQAWKDNQIYFQVWQDGQPIKPTAGAETFRFWVHPSKGFVIVNPRLNGSVLRDQLTYTSRSISTLRRKDGFMPYVNGSEVQVDSSWVSVSGEGVPMPDRGSPVDVNRDGMVDILDLAEVGSHLGQSGDENAADVDGDGTVTTDDIQLVFDAVNDTRFISDAIRAPVINISPPEGMVLIPAGEFEMGSEAYWNEMPIHKVYIDAFYMDTHEVTNAEYTVFLNAKNDQEPLLQWEWVAMGFSWSTWVSGPRKSLPWINDIGINDFGRIKYVEGKFQVQAGYEDHPVNAGTWYGAMAYAAWAGKRLPTEAEWEKAARGGLSGQKYPWGNTIDSSKANFGNNVGTHGETTPVGSYPANGYGLFDMAGNAYEWCLDEVDLGFYRKSATRNPVSGANSIQEILDNYTNITSQRILRGGAHFFPADYLRVSKRYWYEPTNVHFGFRCVKSVSP